MQETRAQMQEDMMTPRSETPTETHTRIDRTEVRRNRRWASTVTRILSFLVVSFTLYLASATTAVASEADLAIPSLEKAKFFNDSIDGWWLMFTGAWVICGTLGISLYLRAQVKNLPAHQSMLDVAEIIFQTCKTYLIQQGKFLLMLFVFIAIAIGFYFYLEKKPNVPASHTLETIGLVLLSSIFRCEPGCRLVCI
jgi:K(+)-stimulated pyrophosphate-energized sodium pump